MRRRTFLAAAIIAAASSKADAADEVNLLFDGDSIAAGAGASHGHGLDALVAAALGAATLGAATLGANVRLHNVAVGGRPVSTCLQLYPTLVAPLYSPESRSNVIVFHAGDNDIGQRRSAEQTYAAFTAYIAAAHEQGWKVVVSTELQRPGFSATQQAELADYNKLLVANSNSTDDVVNFDADPRMSDMKRRSDPSLFSQDGIHPSDGGYAVLAAMLIPAVKRAAGR